MSHLTLVRHGQASFLADDYDQLSERGLVQSERLGKYWSSILNGPFDLVVYGPAKRHLQTGEVVADAFRKEGLSWPEPVEIPEFDEFQAFELMRAALPGLLERDPAVRELEMNFRTHTDAREKARAFEKLFQRVTRLWVAGELKTEGVEPWEEFCARVVRGLEQVRELAGRKANVVVFTSGGPISAAAGTALGLTPVKTLELSWVSRNSSYSEFLFSDGRFSLSSFNVHPHITEAHLLTYR